MDLKKSQVKRRQALLERAAEARARWIAELSRAPDLCEAMRATIDYSRGATRGGPPGSPYHLPEYWVECAVLDRWIAAYDRAQQEYEAAFRLVQIFRERRLFASEGASEAASSLAAADMASRLRALRASRLAEAMVGGDYLLLVPPDGPIGAIAPPDEAPALAAPAPSTAAGPWIDPPGPSDASPAIIGQAPPETSGA